MCLCACVCAWVCVQVCRVATLVPCAVCMLVDSLSVILISTALPLHIWGQRDALQLQSWRDDPRRVLLLLERKFLKACPPPLLMLCIHESTMPALAFCVTMQNCTNLHLKI